MRANFHWLGLAPGLCPDLQAASAFCATCFKYFTGTPVTLERSSTDFASGNNLFHSAVYDDLRVLPYLSVLNPTYAFGLRQSIAPNFLISFFRSRACFRVKPL